MRAVIFDLDGTLIDSAPDIHAAVNNMLAEAGEGEITYEQTRSFIGNGVAVLVERVIAAQGLDPDRHPDLLDIFMRYYNADPATLTQLYPNVRHVLETLRGDGARLGVCTNKPAGPTREILRLLDIDHFFDAVVGGDTLPVKKPDPAPLLATKQELDGAVTAYVGDSEVDAETAARAGLPFALFTQGYRKVPVDELVHDDRFDDFAALLPILDRLAPVPA